MTTAGPVPALLPPGAERAGSVAVPALGEHTRPILLELGLTDEDIVGLRNEAAL